MSQQFEVRLQETALPSGEIALGDLAVIGGRLQELSTRVSRWVADIIGAGRSPRIVEEAAVLRLAATRPGSAILEIRAGGVNTVLADDLQFEARVDGAFWEIVTGLGADTPPPSAPTSVRESAVGLLDALQRAAPLVSIIRKDGAKVEFRPAERDRSVWRAAERETVQEPVTIVGQIEAVDLRNHRFRIVDDVGNRFLLNDVEEAETAAHLVGQRASACGLPVFRDRGQLREINAPRLVAVDIPGEFTSHQSSATWSLPSGYEGPDLDDGVDLDDDEWATFLNTISGR